MTILDATIVNVALPSIGSGLSTNLTGLQWVVDSYQLTFAALLLAGGALGDRLGSRPVFEVGLALFTLASALCGAAPVLAALVVFRVLQGIGAALVVPASLALIRQTFAEEATRARATGVWGAIAGIAAGAGPVLGGILVGSLGWRSVFLVNLPVGLAAMWLVHRYVSPTAGRRQRGLDVTGQTVGVLALGLLTFGIIEGGNRGWSAAVIVSALVASVIAAVIFVVLESRSREPVLPLDLFGSPSFSAGTLVGFLINFGFYGQLFFMSVYFQQVRGYSAPLTGLALLPELGVVAASSFLSGRLTGHVGPRLPMIIGLAAGGPGLAALLIVGPTTPYVLLAGLLVAIGFGMSFTMPAMTTAVTEAAPRDQAGIASGVLNAARQVGGALGVALLGSLVGHASFSIAGMQLAGVLAGLAFLAALACTLTWVRVSRASAG